MSEQKTPPLRVLTVEHLDRIEEFLASTLGERPFPTYMGIEGWEWFALLVAARKGLADAKRCEASRASSLSRPDSAAPMVT